MDVPLFVPTVAGGMSAMATVPDSGRVRGPAVALLPGHEAERVRIDALRDIAHALADAAQPVISFDYPGIGMSPSKALPRDKVPAVLGEACDWFRRQAGVCELALAGTCGGARLSLAVAARNRSVTRVVAQGLPMHLRQQTVKSRVRAGIAALDWVGPRLVGPLTRGSHIKYSTTEWNQELADDICTAALHAQIELVFGGEDELAYRDFLKFKESGRLPPETADKLEISLSPREGLDLLSNIEDQAWFSGIVVRCFSASVEFVATER